MKAFKRLVLSLAAGMARLLPQNMRQAFYRNPRLANAIRQGLNRAAPPGMSIVQVAAGGLAGASLELDLQAEKTYWLGTYEPELQAAVANWVQPGWVAYDVGANIGYITLLLGRAVGPTGKVFAFEPLPENLSRIQRNLALNQSENIELIPAAVIDERQKVEFLTGPSSKMGKVQGSAGHHKQVYGDPIQVQGLSLDDFTLEPGRLPPQVVKMDIEGGEVLALPGMRRLLRETRPLLFLELHGPEAARTAWDTLTQVGYTLYKMEDGYPLVESFQQLDWKAYLLARPEAGT